MFLRFITLNFVKGNSRIPISQTLLSVRTISVESGDELEVPGHCGGEEQAFNIIYLIWESTANPL